MLKVSVVHSVRSRKFLAALTALVSVVAMLVGARVAVADSVWVQSYERTSQTQACAAQPGETPWQAAWGADASWKPSWEQWANAGKGGWTCTRSITWAQTPVAGGTSARTYALGETGPGGGLIFLISGGKTYEMAPKNWDDPTNVSAVDPTSAWCSNTSSLLSGTFGTVVGTGQANTALMVAGGACISGAANAVRGYAGGGLTDWFLPSKDELNAMCNYSRTWTGTPSTGACIGVQNVPFAASTYGFTSFYYSSSSQNSSGSAWYQYLANGGAGAFGKGNTVPVRPVRAF